MATHDYVLDNATGANFRSDLNNALAAIVSNNSSSSEPSTKYAYQWWADTNEGVLKIRNSSNDGWVTLLQLDGTLTLEDGSATAPAIGFRDDLNTGIFSSASDTLNIATGGTDRAEFNSNGMTVAGSVTATSFVGNIDAVDGDFDGTLEADAITVAGVALSTVIAGTTLTQAAQTNITSLGNLTGLTLSGDMTFTGDSANIVFDKSDSSLEFADTARAKFGSSADCHIHHDGTDTFISNDTGDLVLNNIGGNSDDIFMRSADNIELQVQSSESAINCIGNGAVELYYDNTKVAETLSTGFRVNNQFSIGESVLNFEKSGVHHHRIVGNDTGNDLGFQQSSDTGSNTNFTTYLRINDGGDIALPVDNQKLKIGAGADLQLYHLSDSSYIENTNSTGHLYIRNTFSNSHIHLQARSGEESIFLADDGEVQLYFDNSKKLATKTYGIDVTGEIRVNGSALATGGGKVNQVVQSVKTGTVSTTNSSYTPGTDTGLNVTITPSASDSKVLILIHANFASSSCRVNPVLKDGSSAFSFGVSNDGLMDYGLGNSDTDPIRFSFAYLVTPGDTSAHTYKLFFSKHGGSGTAYFNYASGSGQMSVSTMTAIEVLA